MGCLKSTMETLVFDILICWKEAHYPDNKVHGANMGPTWVLSAPDGPHSGPMNLAIRVYIQNDFISKRSGSALY